MHDFGFHLPSLLLEAIEEWNEDHLRSFLLFLACRKEKCQEVPDEEADL